jgi:two-component system, LytTR family, sensor histidine kinase AlgZ
VNWYSSVRGWARDILYLTLLSLLVVLTFFVLQGGMNAPHVAQVFRRALIGSFPIGFCIGGVSWLVMPAVARRAQAWHALIRWPVYLATMTVTATVGTVIAGVGYYYGFGFSSNRTFLSLLGEALRTSIPITWIMGSVITVLGTISGRLHATELALRTHQLDKERVEKLATEAQLASLTSRVQPHFLFNTLNSISALVREDPAHAEALIERLASLLRSSLDGAQTVPLERELQLVADYLEIQQARFGERLRYELPPAADFDATVPPFAVQSVVENSLKHVGSRRAEGVTVRVTAMRSGADLFVDITDDGPGFAEDALKASHGLDNLQLRLRALYGERAGLEFLRPPDGMTVRLRVPAT